MAATKTQRRRPASRAATRRTPRRAEPPAQPSSNTLLVWGIFAFAGLVLAAGIAAITAENVPFEDRHMRDVRARVRNAISRGSIDALEAAREQLGGLQSEVQRRIASWG